MATIILNPGERFEHAHDHASTSSLIAGEVRFEIEGQAVALPLGQTVEVPAGASHVIYNTGAVPAQIYCAHREATRGEA